MTQHQMEIPSSKARKTVSGSAYGPFEADSRDSVTTPGPS
jgi:hypothetical protein